MALMVRRVKEREVMAKHLVEVASKIGLKINQNKSKLMRIGTQKIQNREDRTMLKDSHTWED